MKLREIYGMHPEYSEFLYKNFSCQVSGLRKMVKSIKHQSAMDEKALATYIQHHPVLYFLAQGGYIQWQGSKAQELLKTDIENGMLDQMKKQELWLSRPE